MSLGKFIIDNPVNEERQYIYYNSNDNKVELLQKVILDYWEDYCNECWIWLGKWSKYQWNYEDRVKRFLNRCADFLLMGEYRKGNIMTGNDIKRIIANEYSLDGDWEDEEVEVELEETVKFLNRYVDELDSGEYRILADRFVNPPSRPKKKTKTKFDKIERIFSKPDKKVITYKTIPVSHSFSVIRQDYKIIEGWEGIISPTLPYTSNWCLVDVDNTFEFNECKYKISNEVKQYERNKNGEYEMDKILIYQQGDNLYFFDQNIDIINNEYIVKL